MINLASSWHTLIAREWKCLNVNLWKFLSISPLFSSPTTQSYILVKSQRFLMATLKTRNTNPPSWVLKDKFFYNIPLLFDRQYKFWFLQISLCVCRFVFSFSGDFLTFWPEHQVGCLPGHVQWILPYFTFSPLKYFSGSDSKWWALALIKYRMWLINSALPSIQVFLTSKQRFSFRKKHDGW